MTPSVVPVRKVKHVPRQQRKLHCVSINAECEIETKFPLSSPYADPSSFQILNIHLVVPKKFVPSSFRLKSTSWSSFFAKKQQKLVIKPFCPFEPKNGTLVLNNLVNFCFIGFVRYISLSDFVYPAMRVAQYPAKFSAFYSNTWLICSHQGSICVAELNEYIDPKIVHAKLACL